MPLRLLRLDALAKASRDLDSGPSIGGQLRLTGQWPATPWLASIDGEYRLAKSNDGALSIGWLGFAAGPGAAVRAAQGRIVIEGRLEALAESLFASGIDP